MTDISASSASAAAIAELLAQYGKGFSVDEKGVLTARDAVRITGARQLMEISRAPKVLKIGLGGQDVEIEVRVLTDEEVDAINTLVPNPTPPAKTKMEGGKKVPDGFDRNDPKYLEDVNRVYELKRALSIEAGVPSLSVEGNTAEEKSAWLRKNFATNLLDTLYAGVRALSTDALERASFL